MRTLFVALLLLLSGATWGQSYLTIIIDDIGNNRDLGENALQLDGPINYAVIPHTPHSVQLAELANEKGKEVLLHMPMSNTSHSYQSIGMLHPNMDRQTFDTNVARNIAAVPHVSGVNNHMGSEMTQHYPQMRWLMQSLYSQNLYFIDSRTTPHSQGLQAARDSHIASDRRHVFLDNQTDEAYINKQLDYAVNTALESGFAVAIGHPHRSTIEVLKQRLATLANEGVTLVSTSHYLALQQAD
jgi:polysaccharide deacetylase 2 family uncharacterized protein YibQ